MSQTEFSLPWLEISREGRLAELVIAEKACYEVLESQEASLQQGVRPRAQATSTQWPQLSWGVMR